MLSGASERSSGVSAAAAAASWVCLRRASILDCVTVGDSGVTRSILGRTRVELPVSAPAGISTARSRTNGASDSESATRRSLLLQHVKALKMGLQVVTELAAMGRSRSSGPSRLLNASPLIGGLSLSIICFSCPNHHF